MCRDVLLGVALGLPFHKSLFHKGRSRMTTVGYARVSTRDQSLDIQIDQLKAAGCVKIFSEKLSGAKSDRLAWRRMLKSLQPGDVVVVARLDRFARSTRDLPNTLHEMTE